MPTIEGMTPETLGTGALVKFNAACPVIATLTKDGASISIGTFSGKDTLTVEIPGDYLFKDTCECTSSYTVLYAGEPAEGGIIAVDNTDVVAANEATTTAITDVTGTDCNGDPALNVVSSCEWRPAFFASGCDIISGQIKFQTADGTVVASIVTHDPSGVLVKGDDAMALTEIDPAQYPDGLPCAKDDFDNTLKVGVTKTIDVAANDTLCANFATKTYTIANATNVTVVDNGDGTFDVTPTAGSCGASWSFDYTVTCAEGSATATVSGEIEDTLVTHSFSTANETTVNLGLQLSGGGTYDVDWGDGNVETAASSNSVNVTHTYGANYTGDITITYSSCSVITEFRSTQGHWDFDIGTLPVGLTYYRNAGQNTSNGDIGTLPVGLTYYRNEGQNTTTGDIGTLPVGLTYYRNAGQNTTTGDVGALPVGLTYYLNAGQNTTTGNVDALPVGLTHYRNEGQNTTTGNVDALPVGLTYYLNFGQNTTTGDIGALPVGLTTYINTGQNTTTGDVDALPVGLVNYTNQGQNTTTGDIGMLPVGLTYYANQGQNTATMPNAAWGGSTTMRHFLQQGNNTQNDVDNMLVALANNVTTWVTEKLVNVAGNNAAPSATGTAAIPTIQAAGATVTTN